MRTEGKNLRHMSETEILVHSKALSGRTNAEIAREMGLGEETVARYLRPPRDGEHAYGLPIGRVALWNRAVRNSIVNDWIDQHSGGMFLSISGPSMEKADVIGRISKVNRESADVIEALVEALRDGRLCRAELEHLEKELVEQRVAVEGAILSVRGRMALS